MWKALIPTLLGAVAPLAAHAADELNVSKGATLAGPGLAAHGYDVVSFFTDAKAEIGSDKYAVAHAGGTYRFVKQAHHSKPTPADTRRPMAASALMAWRSARVRRRSALLEDHRRQALPQPQRRSGGMVEGHFGQPGQGRDQLAPNRR